MASLLYKLSIIFHISQYESIDIYYHFFFLTFFLALPASLIAIAMLCFSGWPACLSSEILSEITFLDLPFLSGISFSSYFMQSFLTIFFIIFLSCLASLCSIDFFSFFLVVFMIIPCYLGYKNDHTLFYDHDHKSRK